MRFRPLSRVVCLWVLTLSVHAVPPHADEESGGLRTEFGEVRLQNLAIGKTYSVSRMAAAPLVIRNTGEETLQVHLEVVVPSRHELRAGALPLPERRWVRLEKTDFLLPAGATVSTDVHLTLPYDPDLAGKTYQVDFWSGDVNARGGRRARGQSHLLLFTVEMDYRDDTEAQFSRLDAGPRHPAR